MINFYKTKPCTIEAVQYTGDNVPEIKEFVGDDLVGYDDTTRQLSIFTLEGIMRANVYDYIIKGLRGEFYPCKPDVFVKKYQIIEGGN